MIYGTEYLVLDRPDCNKWPYRLLAWLPDLGNPLQVESNCAELVFFPLLLLLHFPFVRSPTISYVEGVNNVSRRLTRSRSALWRVHHLCAKLLKPYPFILLASKKAEGWWTGGGVDDKRTGATGESVACSQSPRLYSSCYWKRRKHGATTGDSLMDYVTDPPSPLSSPSRSAIHPSRGYTLKKGRGERKRNEVRYKREGTKDPSLD